MASLTYRVIINSGLSRCAIELASLTVIAGRLDCFHALFRGRLCRQFPIPLLERHLYSSVSQISLLLRKVPAEETVDLSPTTLATRKTTPTEAQP